MDLRTYFFIVIGVGLVVWVLYTLHFPFIVVPIVLFFGGLIHVAIKEGNK